MHKERMRLRDRFHALFAEEAEKRPQRLDLSWVKEEAEAMLTHVNTARLNRGKQPFRLERYELMDNMCAGHSDYHAKLALGCMELVLDHD